MSWISRAAAVAALGLVAAVPAHADNAGFFGYLRDHGYTGRYADGSPVNIERTLLFGTMACANFRNGMSLPEQQPRYWVLPEFPLVAEAAQHELCPDTLGAPG